MLFAALIQVMCVIMCMCIYMDGWKLGWWSGTGIKNVYTQLDGGREFI